MRNAILAALLGLLVGPATASAQSFAGTFVMDGPAGQLVLELRQDESNRLSGTFTLLTGDRFAVDAIVSGAQASGNFVAPGVRQPFLAEIDGQVLRLAMEMGGETVGGVFTRTGGPPVSAAAPGAAPPPGGAQPGRPAGADAAARVPSDWSTYQHPVGLMFRYPSGWELHESGGGLVLIPTGAPRNEQGQPMELFLFGMEGAEGIATPRDPRVAAYLQQQLPGLRQTGGPEPASSPLGPAAAWSFEAQPPGGAATSQTAYVVLDGSLGIFLIHAARSDLLAGRESTAQQLFGSIAWGSPTIDPALLRRWTRSRTEGDTGVTGAHYMTTTTVYVFEPDGTVYYSSQSRLDISTDMASAYSRGGPGISRGRYGAANGTITILWEKGDVTAWNYRVFPHEGSVALRLDDPQGGQPLFFEPR